MINIVLLCQLYRAEFERTYLNDFFVFLRCSCNVCYSSKFCHGGDLNCEILYSYANYTDKSLSAFFEMCIFGGVLSDINYEYLLMKLCEIIDRNGFGVGWDFWNLKNFLKIFLFNSWKPFVFYRGQFLIFPTISKKCPYFARATRGWRSKSIPVCVSMVKI